MRNSLKSQDQNINKKLLKYILFGLIIAISLRYIPSNTCIHNSEVIIISAISSITFGIIDMVAPSIQVN